MPEKCSQRQRYYKAIVLLCLGMVNCVLVKGQTMTFPNAAGLQFQRGFIFQHKVDMDQLVTGHISGWELFYQRQHTGEKPWEYFYNFPQTGVAVQYLDFNNNILGKAFAVNPYISFPLKRTQHFEWHFRLASGLGVFTKVFDLQTNRKNSIIGSRITGSVQFMMQAKWKFSSWAELTGGLSFGHFSNGAWKVPNAGINYPGLNIGLTIHAGQPLAMKLQSFAVVPKGWSFLVWTGWFGKETDPVLSGKYLAGTLSLNVLKRHSGKGSFGAAIDLMADGTLKKRRDDDMPETPMRIGVAGLYEFHFGKLSLPVQLGAYVYDPFRFDFPVYQRIGWRYKIHPSWLLNMTLKAHLNKADYLELGVGYVFGKR